MYEQGIRKQFSEENAPPPPPLNTGRGSILFVSPWERLFRRILLNVRDVGGATCFSELSVSEEKNTLQFLYVFFRCFSSPEPKAHK